MLILNIWLTEIDRNRELLKLTHILIIEDDEKILQFLEHALCDLEADLQLSFSVSAADALVREPSRKVNME